MTLKLFEFLEQFKIEIFLINYPVLKKKLDQKDIFRVAEKSYNQNLFPSLEVDHLFCDFYIYAF